MTLLHADLTGKILRAYYSVFNALPPVYPAPVYLRAMIADLKTQGVVCEAADTLPIKYKGAPIGKARLDILTTASVLAQAVVVDQITPRIVGALLSYLKVFEKQVGLAFRFGTKEPAFERRVMTEAAWREHIPSRTEPMLPPDQLQHPEYIYAIVGALIEVHQTLGTGFSAWTYARAGKEELRLRGLPVRLEKTIRVFYEHAVVGEIRLPHLLVGQAALVVPLVSDRENVSGKDLIHAHMQVLKPYAQVQNIPFAVVADFSITPFNPLVLRV